MPFLKFPGIFMANFSHFYVEYHKNGPSAILFFCLSRPSNSDYLIYIGFPWVWFEFCKSSVAQEPPNIHKISPNYISESPYNTPFKHRFDFLSTNTNIFSTSRNFRSTNNNIFSNNNIIILNNNSILQWPLRRKNNGHAKKYAERPFRNRYSKARAKNSIQKRLLKISSLYG
jgi:hypothetical protein